MKTLLLLTIMLLHVNASAANAKPSDLVVRDDASPPYILQIHLCDLSKFRRRADGSTFGRVKSEPQGVYLAVTPMVREKIHLEETRDWLRYMESNKEIIAMESKIKEFENNGNIAAMKHWNRKLLTESQIASGRFKYLTVSKFITKEISNESIKKYYAPSFGGGKYQSLDEMHEDFENYCNF